MLWVTQPLRWRGVAWLLCLFVNKARRCVCVSQPYGDYICILLPYAGGNIASSAFVTAKGEHLLLFHKC